LKLQLKIILYNAFSKAIIIIGMGLLLPSIVSKEAYTHTDNRLMARQATTMNMLKHHELDAIIHAQDCSFGEAIACRESCAPSFVLRRYGLANYVIDLLNPVQRRGRQSRKPGRRSLCHQPAGDFTQTSGGSGGDVDAEGAINLQINKTRYDIFSRRLRPRLEALDTGSESKQTGCSAWVDSE